MERLTQRHDEFEEIAIMNPKDQEGFYEITDLDVDEDKELLLKVSKKLAHYEDLIEQGKLVEVVRCGECRFQGNCQKEVVFSWGMQEGQKIEYCSYGERRKQHD